MHREGNGRTRTAGLHNPELRNQILSSAPGNYVSVLYNRLLQPIADLFELMDSSGPRGPNDFQASEPENGYSSAIVVLSVLALESALNRVRHVRNENERVSPIETLRNLRAGELADDVEELFVLRDIIAHNHIWQERIRTNNEHKTQLLSAELSSGYGDRKYSKVVDMETRLTRRLKLDVVPIRIHRATAVVVLKTCVASFHFLEGSGGNYLPLASASVLLRDGRELPFCSWVEALR